MAEFGLDDVYKIEEGAESEEEHYKSLQRAINSLEAWKFQGSYGRAMMAAIDEGRCMLGTEPTRDYYRNRIPSRTEVKDGTKGSRGFVVENSGEEWAAMMENV